MKLGEKVLLKILTYIKNIRPVSVPEVQREEFQRSVDKVNLFRAKLTALVFILLEILLLALSFIILKDVSKIPERYYIVLYLIMLFSMSVFLRLFEKLNKNAAENSAKIQIAGICFISFILSWCGGISLLDQMSSGQIMVYVVAIIAVAVTPVFKPSVMFLIYLVVQTGFLILLVYIKRNSEIPIGDMVNSSAFVIVSWTISYMRYNRYVIAFNDRKLIEEKNIELEILNLELQKANKKLEQLTRIDGLTGIYNRVMFDRTIRGEWDRCRRYAMPLTLVMADVDFFKSFNDRYGHQAGDNCIKLVAGALSECAKRASDTVARYGGDEFSIILPCVDSKGAEVLAERMKKKIEDLAIPHASSRVSQYITISAGACTATPSEDLSIEEFIRNADKSLYKAKKRHNDVAICDYGKSVYEQLSFE